MMYLGVPYTTAELDDGEALARGQAEAIANEIEVQGGPGGLATKEITALVAYLQVLGTMVDFGKYDEGYFAEFR